MSKVKPKRRKVKLIKKKIYFIVSVIIVSSILFFLSLPILDNNVMTSEISESSKLKEKKSKIVITSNELVRPAWNISLEIDHLLPQIKLKLEFFSKKIENFIQKVPNISTLNKTCHFVYPLNRKVTRYEYSTGRFRKNHTKSPIGLFDSFQQRINNNNNEYYIFNFTDSLPWTLKQTPIVLSNEFNITRSFGRWKSFFRNPIHYSNLGSLNSYDTNKEEILPTVGEYSNTQYFEKQPPMYILIFPNAVTSSGHVITCDGSVYTAGGCLRKWYLPAIHEEKQLDWYTIIIPICDDWCKGYFHFTHEHLIRIALVHKILLEREDTKLILYTPSRSFQHQWLIDVLGIPSSRILYSNRPIHGNLILYPMPNTCGTMFTHLLYSMRHIVFERLDLKSFNIPIKKERKLNLYFAERRGLSRMPSNYYELKKRLIEEYNDIFLFSSSTNSLHVSKQIKAFYEADIVIGPHGANLANVMWMRHGTHLMEFMSYTYANMCYHTTASSINVTHHAIFHKRGKDQSYNLSYDDIKRHIDYAIKDLRVTS